MSDEPTTARLGRPAAESLLTAAQEIIHAAEQAHQVLAAGDLAWLTNMGACASAHALLAIEARLGEIVEQHRIANAMSGTGHMGVFNSDAEVRPAREALRRLLGLVDPEMTGEPAGGDR